MVMENLSLGDVRIDGGTQQRAEINQEHVADLADAMKAGAKIPPVKVFHDGAHYWLSRGFHRYHAHRARGLKMIGAEVFPGTQRDAKLDSVGDNAEHNALRRSNADKRKAVETLLSDDEWKEWSDREISRRCAVSNTFVTEIRKAHLSTFTDAPAERPARKATRKGKTITQKPKASKPKPTAAVVADAAPEPPPTPAPAPRPAPVNDENGTPLPNVKGIRDAFEGKSGAVEILNHLTQLTSLLNRHRERPAGVTLRAYDPRIKAAKEEIRTLVTATQPWTVCGDCKGKEGGCDRCRRLGWHDKETAARR